MPRREGGVNRQVRCLVAECFLGGVNVVSSTEPTTRVQPVAARERLLLAAVEAFAAKGFNATTTRDIANGAQMSSAAVYVHFRSKEELLFELSDAGHRRIMA